MANIVGITLVAIIVILMIAALIYFWRIGR